MSDRDRDLIAAVVAEHFSRLAKITQAEWEILGKIQDYGWIDPYYPPFGLNSRTFPEVLKSLERRGLIKAGPESSQRRHDEVPYTITQKGQRAEAEFL